MHRQNKVTPYLTVKRAFTSPSTARGQSHGLLLVLQSSSSAMTLTRGSISWLVLFRTIQVIPQELTKLVHVAQVCLPPCGPVPPPPPRPLLVGVR